MDKLAKLLSACLLTFCGFSATADQSDIRLHDLFTQLSSASNPSTAGDAEAEIWTIWGESGDEKIDELMVQGVQAMGSRDLDDALKRFDQITRLAPGFAEGWNKRATVYYLRDDLAESVIDIQKTLELEPRHFGALSGMGLIFMERGDFEGALGAYEEVLKIHPQSMAARFHSEHLREKLYGESL